MPTCGGGAAPVAMPRGVETVLDPQALFPHRVHWAAFIEIIWVYFYKLWVILFLYHLLWSNCVPQNSYIEALASEHNNFGWEGLYFNVTILGKEVIKLQWGHEGRLQSSMTGVLREKGEFGHRHACRETAMWILELCCYEPRNAKDCPLATKCQRVLRQILHHRPRKEPILPHLSLGLLASRTVKEYVSIVEATPFRVFYYSSASKLTYPPLYEDLWATVKVIYVAQPDLTKRWIWD